MKVYLATFPSRYPMGIFSSLEEAQNIVAIAFPRKSEWATTEGIPCFWSTEVPLERTSMHHKDEPEPTGRATIVAMELDDDTLL